jgi:hypothetical protein
MTRRQRSSSFEKARYWADHAQRLEARAVRKANQRHRLTDFFRSYREAASRLFAVIQKAAQEEGGEKTPETNRRIQQAAEEFRSVDPFFADLDSPQQFWSFFDLAIDRLDHCYVETPVADNKSLFRPQCRLILSQRAVERVWASIANDLAELDHVDLDALMVRMRSSLRRSVLQFGYWAVLQPELKPFGARVSVRQKIHCYIIHTGFSPPVMVSTRLNFDARPEPSSKGGPDGTLQRLSSSRDFSVPNVRRTAAGRLHRRAPQSAPSIRGPLVHHAQPIRRPAAGAR